MSIAGGFLDGMNIDFTDGLNCLIGHRGAGKTTALEFIRHALDGRARRDTVSGGNGQKRQQSLVADNLGDGRVRLRIETADGIEYLVDRTAAGETIIMDAAGNPSEVSLAGGVFKADIYSQNEVESIADDPRCQLGLIDNFVADDIRRIDAELRKLDSKLSTNGGRIIDVRRALEGVGDELSTLPGIQDKLKAMAAKGGDGADAINQAHKLNAMRDRERRAVASAIASLTTYASSLDSLIGQLAQPTGVIESGMLTGPNADLLSAMVQEVKAAGVDVDKLLKSAKERANSAAAVIEDIKGKLKPRHDEQELAFRELLAKQAEAKGQEAERIRLEGLRNELLEKKRLRDEHLEALKRLQEERRGLLAQLSQLRDERFALRRQVAERITASLSPRIRVRVEQFGDPTVYRELLLDALAGTGINRHIVAQKIADSLSPSELAAMVLAGNAKALADRAALNPNQAANVISALSAPKAMFRLETTELADKPSIELLDGDAYKESTALSTGQKCTTILPILLLDSDSPLLIDQPEDNLDNGFIYDTVVESIHKAKGRRQMIFVTHNPNIPVLGDAEKVVVLKSNGARASIVREGTVDECRDEIVTLLEGGAEAFRKRKERYRF